MDLASLCAAFGLSAAAGLNAWLPLFAGALAQRLDLWSSRSRSTTSAARERSPCSRWRS